MTAGIHEVFRGSPFFSNAGVGKINKNLNIEFYGLYVLAGGTRDSSGCYPVKDDPELARRVPEGR